MPSASFLLSAAASALLLLPSAVSADDHLVSDKRYLFKRQEVATKNITFLHVNDVHAHLDEFRSNGVDCPRNTTERTNVTRVPCFGGYARILQRASEIRAEVPNSLFLNAGDEFQGTLFYSYYGGEVISEVLNQGNFSAFTLGNHEFDGGDDMLAAFLANLTFPTVSSNIESDNEALASQLNPYLLFPEHEMALVALTTNTTPDIASPGNGTTFGAYLDVQGTVDSLLNGTAPGQDNTTVSRVIALTHIGYENDIELARNTRNIHLIIGGHSHTRLGNDSAAGEYPTIVRNLDDQEVFVVTAWRWGQQLGRIDVEFALHSDRILSYTGGPINMTEEVAQNETIQDQVLGWRQPFDEFSRQVVGQTATDLDQTTCQQGECTLGNAVTDSMVYARTRIGATVDFGLHNAGGIRASIDAPEVTRGEILTAFPFGNQLVDVSYTGREIWGIFEGIVSDVNSVGRAVTSFVQISSEAAFSYNPNNPVGSRLISMNISGTDIDFERTYTIVTLDFIATGGDSFFPNAPAAPPATLGSQSDVFEAWVVANTPLNVQLENRITITDQTVPQHTV